MEDCNQTSLCGCACLFKSSHTRFTESAVFQVPVQVPVASHAEQLIAEEHEAAARAAAKKAKKQRQKANKQQAQVSIAIVNAASTELPVQPEEEQNSSLASVASTGPDEAAASTSAPAGSTPDAEAQPEQAATALEASFASATPLHGDDQFVDASPVAVEEVQLETAAKHMPSLFICPLTKVGVQQSTAHFCTCPVQEPNCVSIQP